MLPPAPLAWNSVSGSSASSFFRKESMKLANSSSSTRSARSLHTEPGESARGGSDSAGGAGTELLQEADGNSGEDTPDAVRAARTEVACCGCGIAMGAKPQKGPRPLTAGGTAVDCVEFEVAAGSTAEGAGADAAAIAPAIAGKENGEQKGGQNGMPMPIAGGKNIPGNMPGMGGIMPIMPIGGIMGSCIAPIDAAIAPIDAAICAIC